MNSGVTLHIMTTETFKNLSIVPLKHFEEPISICGINKLN